ncbi:hypothetical protein AA0117_g7143 [Alternaria alternata]|jgi:hypothetical protein|uniref:BTB domain-containing protein n=1 Tax=Alternaria alternata TaxID=5599 RepID=A0A4Q4NCR7_ALTAL|nr:hypothetical protein AA0117_g7143 [Alternaria alternata]
MATAPSFWAAGNNKIKSAESPNPKIAEAPPKPKPGPQQKKGLVLKGISNGHITSDFSAKPAVATDSRKADWADDDDDNSFIAEFMSQDPKVATLETTVALKQERVKELEAVVITKTLRVAELEGAVQDKDHHISDLEAEVQEKDSKIRLLKKENSDRLLQNQKLLREAHEKDSQIKKLEVELKGKAVTVRSLEQESAALVPVPTNDAELITEDELEDKELESTKIDGTDGITEAENEVDETFSEASDSFEIVDPPRDEETRKIKEQETEATTTGESVDTVPTKKSCGPSFGESKFPTFVTKNMLKIVPPAPKPKTLTFPIDMSKYGKKSTAPPTTKIVRPSSTMIEKNGHTTPWGQSSKQARDKTGAMPEFDYSADIRHMPHSKRMLFGNGPEVVVKLGDVKLATVTKYVLMQCSFKALEYFTRRPEATSWILPADSMDVDSATAHLKWMDEMTYQSRIYSLKFQTEHVHDKKNLKICHAARVLGLNNIYVAQFTKQFCDRIRAEDISPEFMDLVCQLAYPDNDPIFDCLANNLVNRKKVGNDKGAAELEKLLAKYALLKDKVDKIEKRLTGRPRKTWMSPEGSARGGSNDRSSGKGRKSGDAEKSLPNVVQPAPGNKPVAPAAEEALFTILQ